MPLDLTMLYSAVQITGDGLDADGNAVRKVGTGFIVAIPSEIVNRRHGYIVTAHHVVNGLENIRVDIANPHRSGELYPPEFVSDWCQPDKKVDLAFAPYGPPVQTTIALVLGEQVQHGLVLTVGAAFHYVGLLSPLGIPMARSGTLGALDVPGMDHDGPYDYPAHLADVRSYGGFSGSPCFVEYPLANLTPLDLSTLPVRLPENFDASKPLGAMNYMHLFCGMFVEHYSHKQGLGGPMSHLGLGVVLPADPIIEALLTDELRAERREADERFAAAQPESLVRGASGERVESGEFERFEELTERLLRVPKTELDEKLAGS
jgi:trypsin-like peptidase